MRNPLQHLATARRRGPALLCAGVLLGLAAPPLGSSALVQVLGARPAAAAGPEIPSTALLISALNRPHLVRGDDGRDHVEYDLLVTNAFASPVTITSIEV